MEPGLPVKLRVGRKGYVIIPKRIREAVGIEEGDYVVVEVGDASITIRPAAKRARPGEVREKLRRHAERLRELKTAGNARPGELAGIDLEEEFEDEGVP